MENIMSNSLLSFTPVADHIIIQDSNKAIYSLISNEFTGYKHLYVSSINYNPFIHISCEKYKRLEEVQLISEALVNGYYDEFNCDYRHQYKKYLISMLIMFTLESNRVPSIDTICSLAKYFYCSGGKINLTSNLPDKSLTGKCYRLLKEVEHTCKELNCIDEALKESLVILMFWNNILCKSPIDDLDKFFVPEKTVFIVEDSHLTRLLLAQMPSIIREKAIIVPTQFLISPEITPYKIALHDIALSKTSDYNFYIFCKDNSIYKKVYRGLWTSFARLLNIPYEDF